MSIWEWFRGSRADPRPAETGRDLRGELLRDADRLEESGWGYPVEDELRRLAQALEESAHNQEVARLQGLAAKILQRAEAYDTTVAEYSDLIPDRLANLLDASGLRTALRQAASLGEVGDIGRRIGELAAACAAHVDELRSKIVELVPTEDEAEAGDVAPDTSDATDSLEDRYRVARKSRDLEMQHHLARLTARIDEASRQHLDRRGVQPSRGWGTDRPRSVSFLLSRHHDLRASAAGGQAEDHG